MNNQAFCNILEFHHLKCEGLLLFSYFLYWISLDCGPIDLNKLFEAIWPVWNGIQGSRSRDRRKSTNMYMDMLTHIQNFSCTVCSWDRDQPLLSSFQAADCTLRNVSLTDRTSPLDTWHPIIIPKHFDWQVELTRCLQGHPPPERQEAADWRCGGRLQRRRRVRVQYV